ncbi:hypothetical protein ACFL6Y_02180 [Elusimicrobiota bacterium]
MKTPFSRVFVRLRKEAGFETAYQFFHKNGGAKVFDCSFQNYLKLEDGDHLPKPERLQLLCTLLRAPLTPANLKALALSYLETWFKSADLAKWIMACLREETADKTMLDPGSQALKKVAYDNPVHINIVQHDAILKTQATYWCFQILAASKDPVSSEEISKMVKMPKKEINAAMQILCKHGIAKRVKDDKYQSPIADKVIQFPPKDARSQSLKETATQYNAALSKKQGKLIDGFRYSVRADLDSLTGFIHHLQSAARSLTAYSVDEKKDRSAFVIAEAKLTKLFDF